MPISITSISASLLKFIIIFCYIPILIFFFFLNKLFSSFLFFILSLGRQKKLFSVFFFFVLFRYFLSLYESIVLYHWNNNVIVLFSFKVTLKLKYCKKKWINWILGFFIQWHINLHGLFNAKAIFLETQ